LTKKQNKEILFHHVVLYIKIRFYWSASSVTNVCCCWCKQCRHSNRYE